MHPEELSNILESWSFSRLEASASRHIIPRTLARHIIVEPGIVTVILGVRRSGKSTLLRQVAERLDVLDASVNVNFEDPRLSNQLDYRLLDEIFENVTSQDNKAQVFFFDEIQNVSGWQKWFHSMLARHSKHRFVITGSNSQLLSGEIATALTGRHISYELFPFELEEAKLLRSAKGIQDHKISILEYLQTGGFPAAQSFPDPEKLLAQTFMDIIEKDVRERVSAKSSRPLASLAQIVFESVGSELSLRKLAARTDLSPETINVYLRALEEAFLIFSCPLFAFSEAKRQRALKKYYAIDTGMRKAVTTQTGTDIGKDFENLVYLNLRRRTTEIYYWKGKGEVDFVVKSKKGYTPIQVTTTDPKEEPKPRHEAALVEFYREFPQANEAIIVTPETFETLGEIEL